MITHAAYSTAYPMPFIAMPLVIDQLVQHDPKVWEISPKAYRTNVTKKKLTKAEVIKEATIERYREALTRQWQGSRAIGAQIDRSHTAVTQTMQKDYMVAITEFRVVKNGSAKIFQWRLKK